MKKIIFTTMMVLTLSMAAASAKGLKPIEKLPNSSPERVAWENFHHEVMTCNAFYIIMAQGMKNRGDAESLKLSDWLTQRRMTMFMIGMNLHRADVTIARSRMMQQSLLDEMNGVFSILVEKYTKPCLEFPDNAKGRIIYWYRKAGARIK